MVYLSLDGGGKSGWEYYFCKASLHHLWSGGFGFARNGGLFGNLFDWLSAPLTFRSCTTFWPNSVYGGGFFFSFPKLPYSAQEASGKSGPHEIFKTQERDKYLPFLKLLLSPVKWAAQGEEATRATNILIICVLQVDNNDRNSCNSNPSHIHKKVSRTQQMTKKWRGSFRVTEIHSKQPRKRWYYMRSIYINVPAIEFT